MNLYGFNPEISSPFLGDEENAQPSFPNHINQSNNNNISGQFHEHTSFDESQLTVPNYLGNLLPNDPSEIPAIPDTCFNYINDLLREEYCSPDQFHTPNSTLEDYMAAQLSCNKSLDTALHLGEKFSFSFSSNYNINHDYIHNNQCPPPDICHTSRHCLDDYLHMFSSNKNNINIPSFGDNNDFRCNFVRSSFPLFESSSSGASPVSAPGDLIGGIGGESDHIHETSFGFIVNDKNAHLQDQEIGHTLSREGNLEASIFEKGDQTYADNNTRRRKHDNVEENNDQRKNKNISSCKNDEIVQQIEQYGDVILCPEGRSKPGALCNSSSRTQNSGESSKGSKKRGNKGQVVDLRGLLTRCAQCVAQVNLTGAYDVLKQIREHSSAHGDFLQRVAHYLANGLEARLEGKGLELTLANEVVSPSEVLKANRVFVASVPYQIMSYYTMNKTIAGLVLEAPSIHIIDFGIYYGLQWPCIIQNLSKRPNGPPRIRITGIDFPQRGFRPSERVEETGRCLAKYCEKYNVPFEYYPIAKKWEDVQIEELKIERNEPLVVNCLYRAHLLFDESVEENSPRDLFLKLVRKINPDMFMHAVVNSTSSVPFFLNRFKEVMFHYSALFDIFESTMSREDSERLLLESKVYGPQALNVIACEGVERVERPESYKQWQIRTQRAGFEQVGLDRELLKRARAMVKRSFREEFSYDVDGYWVVQGWKGRLLYAISCWKPI